MTGKLYIVQCLSGENYNKRKINKFIYFILCIDAEKNRENAFKTLLQKKIKVAHSSILMCFIGRLFD